MGGECSIAVPCLATDLRQAILPARVGGEPDANAARTLTALAASCAKTPSAINAQAVVAALPEKISGSDLREIVRRAVLARDSGAIAAEALLAEVGTGRCRASVPTGMYVLTSIFGDTTPDSARNEATA